MVNDNFSRIISVRTQYFTQASTWVLQDALTSLRQDRTTVIVAHRSSMMRCCTTLQTGALPVLTIDDVCANGQPHG